MNYLADTADPRRRWLLEALAAGLWSGGWAPAGALAADLLGQRPTKLPAGQSVFRVSGQATVNDQVATPQSRIASGDTVRTALDSEIVFVVGTSAMLVRGGSEVVVQAPTPSPTVKPGAEPPPALRVVSGRVLSVFAPGQRRIVTPTAAISIRGTGVYIEARAEQTYFCTCYGAADVAALDDPGSREQVLATHHDRPLYILAGRDTPGRNIRRAPFINHTDEELALVEALVGRQPPFVHPAQVYERPRADTDYNR